MEIKFYQTKKELIKNKKIAVLLIGELEADIKAKSFKECQDIFATSGNERYIFNEKRGDLSFRIDCAPANDENYPGSDGKNLMYLQVQDSRTPSGTYANVVYPKAAKAEDIVAAIIESLIKGEGCYLVC